MIDALYNALVHCNAPMLTFGKMVWVAVKMQIRAKFSGSNASTWFGLNTVKFSSTALTLVSTKWWCTSLNCSTVQHNTQQQTMASNSGLWSPPHQCLAVLSVKVAPPRTSLPSRFRPESWDPLHSACRHFCTALKWNCVDSVHKESTCAMASQSAPPCFVASLPALLSEALSVLVSPLHEVPAIH